MTDESDNSTPHALIYRPLVPADSSRVQPVNNAAYPAVPRATVEEMQSLIERAAWGIIAEAGDQVAGFVLCFSPGADYDSENYSYFEARFDQHFYIDRVVVSEDFRGQGIGSALYDRVFQEAGEREASHVTCEVNLEPPNPVSLAFHRQMGFDPLDTQETKGGSVLVQLMSAKVES